jgi:hypothetical protein
MEMGMWDALGGIAVMAGEAGCSSHAQHLRPKVSLLNEISLFNVC